MYFKKLNGCALEVSDINRLLTISNELNETARNHQVENEKRIDANSKLSADEVRKHVNLYQVITVGFWSRKGEYTAFRDATVIDPAELPEVITRVSIENHSNYDFWVGRKPTHEFQITLDCTTPSAFDFTSSMSASSSNLSELKVLGIDHTWVEGAGARLMPIFKKRKRRMSFLHQAGAYDLTLWLLFVPMFCIYLAKVDRSLQSRLHDASLPFQVVIYILFLFISFACYRQVFGLLRWLFPFIEIKNHSNKISAGIRTSFLAIITLLWGNALYDVAKLAIQKLNDTP